MIDSEWRWVYANPAACTLLGQPLERLRGRDFLGSIGAREHRTGPGARPAQGVDPAAHRDHAFDDQAADDEQDKPEQWHSPSVGEGVSRLRRQFEQPGRKN